MHVQNDVATLLSSAQYHGLKFQSQWHPCPGVHAMKFTRRQVLRSAGVALALPCLDAFSPSRASAGAVQPRRRMVCICAPLGLRPDNFFPEKSGKDYELT